VSAVPKRKLTAEQYLAIEREAEFKSEFYAGEMFAMAGASRDHNRIKDNLIGELGARFKGGPCQTFSSDQRVKIDATGLFTYPDVVIVCGPEAFDPRDPDTLLNPTAIIEILSPSTERYDRGTKFTHYQQIPSLVEYVLVSQDEPHVDRFVRQPDGTWVLTVYADPAGSFSLASPPGPVPVSVPLADVYRGVTFPPPTLR
jgi:Uma2 family endonuclease